MSNGEMPGSAPEAPKNRPDEGEAALQKQKEQVRSAAADTEGIDATPLSTRNRPATRPQEGESDISDSTLLKGVNENVLRLAKKNMRSERSYGDLNEITVDNTQFILALDDAGRPYVKVLVYDQSSGDVIVQNVGIAEEDADGAIAYLNPPVPEEDEKWVDQEREKLA